MNVAIITANFGNFDKEINSVNQSIPVTFKRFTEKDMPLRDKSMTPRLQARIIKMFSWQLLPDFNYYIWVDSSCILSHKNSAIWLLNHLVGHDMVVFKHPNRETVKQEADYVKHRLDIKCPYITPRYENELIDDQLREVEPDAMLYASTVFAYRNTPQVQQVLKEWWYHTSRFHSIDQLSFPFVTKDLRVKVIPDSYLKVPYIQYVRK